MNELNERVARYLDMQHLNKTQLAERLNISLAQLSHIYSGRNKPGVDILQKILSIFKDCNARWLLLGEGDMNITKQLDRDKKLKTYFTLNAELLQETIEKLRNLSELNDKVSSEI
jgi:transcriptional regulator with XRE-family HTH domain